MSGGLLESMFVPASEMPAVTSTPAIDPEVAEIIAVRQEAYDRKQEAARVEELKVAFGDQFPVQVGAAFRTMKFSAAKHARYRKLFGGFRQFCRERGVPCMPAHGSTIGAHLLHIAVIDRKPPRAVKEALRAIEYYHAIYDGTAYIDAALAFLAGLGDNGGGGKEPETAVEAHAVEQPNVLPFAAEKPQPPRSV